MNGLRKPQLLSGLNLSPFDLIECAILALWQAHWKHIFDDKPFWPDEAAARATQMLRRMHAKNKLAQPRRSRQPHPVV
ncbi:hypothetical protein G6F37_012764 [Rhizopus arrhizus]|nr:hypothetical protein G6F38_012334 [Rhizopus arrhizus]KAG1141743.1 hypothetical protein G6F37_012764 [Rhizopus arrhizus]